MENNLPRKKVDKRGIAFFDEVPQGNGFRFNTGSSGGGDTTDTGSLLTTASVVSNVITFTKGDLSTFDITVDTGSGGGGAVGTLQQVTDQGKTTTQDITITNSSTTVPSLTMEASFTGNEVDAAPILDLIKNNTSPNDGDYLGQIKFKGKNSSGTDTVYAKITGKVSDVTAGTEDGLIEVAVQKNSTQTITMRFTNNALKLINGTGLEVAGDTTFTGTHTHLLELTSDDTTTDYNSSTPQAIDWTSQVVATPDATSDTFEWTSGANGSKVYIRQDGYFRVNTMTSYAIESGSASARVQLSNRLRVDGSTFINGTDYTSYARNSTTGTQILNFSSTHLTGVVQMSSGSYIESIVTQAGANGVANLDENQSLFIIEKL